MVSSWVRRNQALYGQNTDLVISEWLFDFLAGSQKAKVDECGNSDARNGVPVEIFDKLEGKEKEVDPNGAVQQVKLVS